MALQKVYLGTLGKTKGLQGEIRLHLFNPDSQHFKKGFSFYIDGLSSAFVVDSCKAHQKSFLLRIKNCTKVEDVQDWVGKKIYVDRAWLKSPDEGQYYHVDLVGCKAVDPQGALVGVIKEVLATGANDVLVIENDQKQETLIPFIDQYVLDVDLTQKVVSVVVPEMF